MKRSLKITALLTAVILACSFYISRTPQTDKLDVLLSEGEQNLLEKTETILNAYNADYSVPSVVVGFVESGKAPVFYSHGTMSRDSEVKVNERTKYQLASLTKTFTSILAHHVAKDGKIDLEDPIIKYLPTSLDADTRRKLEPIRVQHILQHTAGFDREIISVKRRLLGFAPTEVYSEEQLLDDLAVTELLFAPGEKMSYSNFGYAVLGYILEQACGESYESLLQRYLLKPLEMNRTSSDFNQDFKGNLAQAYLPELRYVKNGAFPLGKQTPAGGVFSTVEDLTLMMQKQIETYEKFEEGSPFIINRNAVKMWDDPHAPKYGDACFQFGEHPNTVLGHSGDLNGYASSYFFNPAKGVGIVMLTSMGGPWFQYMERDMIHLILQDYQ